MTYGISAATGHLGQIVVEKLKAKAPTESIVALVRNPAKAESLGVAVREFDYNHPQPEALSGVDVLLLISGTELGKRLEQHRNVIEAAKQAGVKRIVYTSLLHADRSTLSLAPEHLGTEEALKASGVPYTILRNGWYFENHTGAIGGAVAGGALIGSAGEGKISAATREDFAEAAVAALTSGGHENRTYELAGDEAWTPSDLAAEISKQTGKEIPYRNLSEADYAATLAGFGIPESFAKAIASWDFEASKGELFDESHQLSNLIGRPTTSLSEAVAQALKQV